VVQWTWTTPPAVYLSGSHVLPLVGNFTDDNNDGAIDLCDTPDVLVTVHTGDVSTLGGALVLLAGDTGKEELVFEGSVSPDVSPAFGDIDGDGLPEVVAAEYGLGRLLAFEHDGNLKWAGDLGGWNEVTNSFCTAISLYDLDGDGTVEILAGFEVFDATGKRLFGVPGNGKEFAGQYYCPTPTAADLDGDGTLEVLFGNSAYRHDGTLLWTVPGPPGHPHVANFDADPDPEILLTTADGITLIEADGTVVFGPVRPTGAEAGANCWGKPGAVHDFDGDGATDAALGSCTDYTVYGIAKSPSPKWSADVSDLSGLATGTAFDFLGDGVADAIYADEGRIYVYEGKTGAVELTAPRISGTLIEYPVVADVDADGSAEIVVVSNYPDGETGPTVTVLRDANDRWIPARRIWNQHAYHVTNVREDGTIPAAPKKSWLGLNTFRTNSQVEGGQDCDPTPK